MSTTAIHSLPYPATTDDVDVPGDIKALAAAVDVALPIVSDTQPSAPVNGTVWYAPTAKTLSFYDGSSWITYLPDTGWQTLTVNSPYAALSGNPPMWRLRNGVVWVKGAITNAGISAGVLMTGVATLPVGSRPIGPCFFGAPSSSAAVIGEWSLSNSGTAGGIDIRTNAAVGSYYFLSPITFIADA